MIRILTDATHHATRSYSTGSRDTRAYRHLVPEWPVHTAGCLCASAQVHIHERYRYTVKRLHLVIGLLACLVGSAFGQATNDITSVSPNSAMQGTSGMLVTCTLDTDTPPAPPTNVLPSSVSIGTMAGGSVAHPTQYTVTAVFDIPSDEPAGTKDVSVTFATPQGDLMYSLSGGFTVTAAGDTPPTINVHPQTQTVVVGDEVTFSVQANGSTPLSYQWQRDQADIAGATQASYMIASVASNDAGSYRCVVTNDFGSVASDAATLTVTAGWPYDGYTLFSPIVDTGQDTCFDSAGMEADCPADGFALYGQDAQHVGNQPSYTLSDDGLTVIDNVTALVWTQSPDLDGDGDIDADDKFTLTQARAYVDTLNAQSFGGYDSWRLPTIKELYSLMDFSGIDPSSDMYGDPSNFTPFIDTACFAFGYGDTASGERVIDAQFASDTEYVSTVFSGQAAVFGLNLADGRIKGYPTSGKTFYVYYVCGNAEYGVNDFVDNADGTITDRASSLMWTQDDSGVGLDWEQALAWVQQKNDEQYLGYDDWTLPDAKQLQSIVDYTRSPDTTSSAAIDPVFNATAIVNEAGQADYPWYWSSTTHMSMSDIPGLWGAYVTFGRAMGYMNNQWMDVHGAGCQRSDPKTGDPADWPTGHGPQGDAIRIYNYVRLVRTVQCGEPGFVSTLDGDMNNDCCVDLHDLATVARGWSTTYSQDDLDAIRDNWATGVDTTAVSQP